MSYLAHTGHAKRRAPDGMSQHDVAGQSKDLDAPTSSGGEETSDLLSPKDRSATSHAEPPDHSIAPELEKRLHWHLLPLFFVLVVFCFVDRANLAFASIQMNEELHIGEEQYGLGAGLFFLGYAMFQVPSNAFLLRLGPSTWLAVITLLWGVCATAFAFCSGVTAFLLLRFLLGLFEAGAMPGMWYSLSLFYPADRTNFPYAVIESGITVSQVVGSPLAAGLLQLDGWLGLSGWQWIFLMEGLPTILMGVYIKYMLPDSISSASFLNPAEKQTLTEHIELRRRGGVDPLTWTMIDQWWLLKSVAGNWRVWYAGGWRIFHDVAGYGVLYWTPMLLESMLDATADGRHEPASQEHHTGLKVVLLAAIPFAAASLFHVVNAHHSQKVGERRLHIALPWLVASLALVLMPAAGSWGFLPGFVCLVLAHVGVNGANGIQTSWVASCFDGPSKALGLPLYNMIGGLGGFFGPYVIGVLKHRSKSYGWAMVLLGAFLFVGSVAVWLFPDRNGDRHSEHKALATEDEDALEHVDTEW